MATTEQGLTTEFAIAYREMMLQGFSGEVKTTKPGKRKAQNRSRTGGLVRPPHRSRHRARARNDARATDAAGRFYGCF